MHSLFTTLLLISMFQKTQKLLIQWLTEWLKRTLKTCLIWLCLMGKNETRHQSRSLGFRAGILTNQKDKITFIRTRIHNSMLNRKYKRNWKHKLTNVLELFQTTSWKSEATRRQRSWRSNGSKKKLKGTQAWRKHWHSQLTHVGQWFISWTTVYLGYWNANGKFAKLGYFWMVF